MIYIMKVDLLYPACTWICWKQLEFSLYAVLTDCYKLGWTHTHDICIYGTFVKKSVAYTVLFLNYIFKIQNINGGIFVPFGKKCVDWN